MGKDKLEAMTEEECDCRGIMMKLEIPLCGYNIAGRDIDCRYFSPHHIIPVLGRCECVSERLAQLRGEVPDLPFSYVPPVDYEVENE